MENRILRQKQVCCGTDTIAATKAGSNKAEDHAYNILTVLGCTCTHTENDDERKEGVRLDPTTRTKG